MSEAEPDVVLYRLHPAWDLPSLSIGCIQVEAYLRLANVRFAVHDCASASASPTGQVPALDTAADLVGCDEGCPPADDLGAARALLRYLQRRFASLDRGLGVAQRADLAAFTALVEAKLHPALLYSTWCEPDAYAAYTRPAYGAALAFPLSRLLPMAQRRAVKALLGNVSPAKAYGDAAEALQAIAGRMAGAAGAYFFGTQPSSLDAILFGCLAYLKAAPVTHPELRCKMEAHPALGAYVDNIAAQHFCARVPSASDAGLRWSSWEPAAGGGSSGDARYSKQGSAKEVQARRKARLWVAGAALAVVAYVVFSGDYVQVRMLTNGELGEDDDGEGGEE